MSLPASSIGPEEPLPPPGKLGAMWSRGLSAASGRLTYALADQVTYSFGNMVVAAILSRHAGRSEFGTYILTQRAMDIFIQICSVFSWAPFMFRLPSTPRERQHIFLGSIVGQQVCACLAFALLLWMGGWWTAGHHYDLYANVMVPLAVTSMAILFREFTRRMYFAELRFKAAFWTEVATVGLQIAGVELLYRFGRLHVPETLQVLSLGAGIVSLYWVLTEWKTFKIRLRDVYKDLRRDLRLGGWLLGGNMISMASAQCNPWLLGAVLGPASVGAYAICESVVNIPRVALNSLQNAMAPVVARSLAKDGKPGLRQVITRYDRALLLGSAVCAAGVVALGPWVARLIFKAFPDNGRMILIFLALNFIAVAATLAQSYGLTALDKAGLVFYANLAGFAVQVLLAIALVGKLNVAGVALAMLPGSIVVVIIRQIFYRREITSP